MKTQISIKKLSILTIAIFIISCQNPPGNMNGNIVGKTVNLSTELTLDTCTTSIGDNVPEFFKTYFKCSDIQVANDKLVFNTKGLPPHKSYYYGKGSPNFEAFDTSRGPRYAPNPNQIKEVDTTLNIPLNPVPIKNLSITKATVDGKVGGANNYPLGSAGIALDSVFLFNPLAKPGDNIEDEKYGFDIYNGHPMDAGMYHYHTVSKGPLEVLKKIGLVTTTEPGKAEVELYGIMCDGTIVMGCTELDGSKPDVKSFDAQNGHIHDIISKDNKTFFTKRYHTHICPGNTDFPDQFTPQVQYYDTCDSTNSINNQ